MTKIKNLFLIVALLTSLANLSYADNLNTVSQKAFIHMKQKEWSEAHSLLERAVESLDPIMNNQVAVLYYNKGYCELMLSNQTANKKRQRHALAAIASFSKCQLQPDNYYYAKSFLYQALANMQLENYKEALVIFDKFENNRKPERDNYNKGQLNLYKATCLFKIAAQPSE